MAYWLLKSEPDDWSWDEQVAKGRKGEAWSGVRNYQARNFMREMKKGDLAFFYHTGKERRIVGVVEIIREGYPDPQDDRWTLVDVAATEPLSAAVALDDIKNEVALDEMVLLKNSRLSVQPVTAAEWKTINKMAANK